MEAPQTIGRYAVERALGTGSVATVWLARDTQLDAWVAIKVLAENWSLDEGVKEKFLDEARILHRLDDPHFVRVMNVDNLDDGRPYFVMEYADAGSLKDRIETGDRPFQLSDAIETSLELAECLIVAHDLGVIHRDLKPSNVLYRTVPGHIRRQLEREGRAVADEQMMLADFGLARLVERTGSHTVGAGTPEYMAPEQAAGRADHRSDIYAAAAILHHLVVGHPPRRGESVAAHPAIDDLLDEALADDPEARPQSAEEWRDDLAALEVASDATAASTAIATSKRRRRRPVRRRHRLTAMLGSLLLIIASGVSGVLVWNAVEPGGGDTDNALADQAAAPLTVGESLLGELGESGADLYSLTAAEGSELVLTVWSEGAAVELDIFDPEGRQIEQASTGAANASAAVTLTTAFEGQYTLRLRSEEPSRYVLGAIGLTSPVEQAATATSVAASSTVDPASAQLRGGEGRSSAHVTSVLGGIPFALLNRTPSPYYPPVAAGDLLLVPHVRGNLRALRGSYGETQWVEHVGLGAYGTPAVRDGFVYLPTVDGVHSLRLDTMEPVWSAAIEEASSGPILLTGDLVVTVADGSLVVALDADDGTERWRFRLNGTLVDAVAAQGRVVVASGDGTITAIDNTTGLALWNVTPSTPPRFLVADDNSLYVASSSTLEARSALDGESLWSYEASGTMTGPPAAAYGMVYLSTADEGGSGRLTALSVGLGPHLCQNSTGCELWDFHVPEGIVGGPTIIGRSILFIRSNGSVSAVDAVLACGGGVACPTVSLFPEGDLSPEVSLTVGDGFFVISDATVMVAPECPQCRSPVSVSTG